MIYLPGGRENLDAVAETTEQVVTMMFYSAGFKCILIMPPSSNLTPQPSRALFLHAYHVPVNIRCLVSGTASTLHRYGIGSLPLYISGSRHSSSSSTHRHSGATRCFQHTPFEGARYTALEPQSAWPSISYQHC